MNYLKTATLVALSMLVCGCMCQPGEETTTTTLVGEEEGTQPTATTAAAAPTTTLKATATTQAASGGGIISDLKAALSSGVGYQCTYTYQNVQSVSKMKGKKFSSTTTVDGQVSRAISDGTWMYTWMDGQAQGIKFNVAEMQKNAQAAPGQKKAPSMDDIASSADNVQCTPTTVSDSEFNPPSGVEFQDMGEFMKQLQGMNVGN
ncbi:MAG: hypothetical protein V1875_09450 [Candidatus Altiarchaeota archaeon]